MGLLDKAKTAAEQAAAKAKDTAQDLQAIQAKKDLFQAYNELGQKAFELAERGELSHPALNEHLQRIRSLKAEETAEA